MFRQRFSESRKSIVIFFCELNNLKTPILYYGILKFTYKVKWIYIFWVKGVFYHQHTHYIKYGA